MSLISVVLALLLFYNGRGTKIFNKSFRVAYLQANARSTLEQMMLNIKQASVDHIFTDRGFNTQVPLPEDAYDNKPYIYFAKPNISSAGDKGGLQVDDYDYWLYYIGRISYEARDERDEKYVAFYDGKARLRSMVIRHQSRYYTEDPKKSWPFPPPILALGVNKLPEDYSKEERKEKKNQTFTIDEFGNVISDPNKVQDKTTTSFLANAEIQDESPEFSAYQSAFFFSFSEGSDSLFKIRINLVDESSNSKVSFESAVTPRN